MSKIRSAVDHGRQFRTFLKVLRSDPRATPMLPQVGATLDAIRQFAKPVRNVSEKERQQQLMGYHCRTLIREMKQRLLPDALRTVPHALRDLSHATEPLHIQHRLAREVQPIISTLSLP